MWRITSLSKTKSFNTACADMTIYRSGLEIAAPLWNNTGVTKNGHKLLSWEEMLEVEDKHPFFAGNLQSLRMSGTAVPRSAKRSRATRKAKRSSTSQSRRRRAAK
jgi:hypothetical protein